MNNFSLTQLSKNNLDKIEQMVLAGGGDDCDCACFGDCSGCGCFDGQVEGIDSAKNRFAHLPLIP